MSDISKKLDSIEKLAKEAERLAKNLQGNPFSVFDRIANDITDREDREMALEFTKCICELLKKNGVTPMIDEYRHETVKENSIECRYGVTITGLDFTEHDKPFERRIKKLESLRYRCHESARDSFDSGMYGLLHIVTADELKNSKDNIQKINLNETIKVKLTPCGAEIYYKQFDEVNKQCGREICKPQMPQIDKDGYTEFQLLHFIELYGQHIGMCKPNVIEPIEIVLCD